MNDVEQNSRGKYSVDAADERRRMMAKHPLLHKGTRPPLWTPPVRECYEATKYLIVQRQSFFIEEPTGEGKTMMMRAISNQLPKDLGDITLTMYEAANKPAPSIRAFFKGFLSALKHPEKSGETADLRERVHRRLSAWAIDTCWQTVVLMIDEAQALIPEDYGFIKDIQNELESEGIDLVVISCGESPALGLMLKDMRRKISSACGDRFARHQLRIRGYDEKSIRALLQAIDVACWPAGTSQTWPGFFFPCAVAHGLLLERDAEILWKGLQYAGLVRPGEPIGANGRGKKTVQSRKVFDAIVWAVTEHAEQDSDSFTLTERDWQRAAVFAAGVPDA
ncbi:ATP-binding protein [Cupriavidus nantongensis]|uniref:ATP-binding protein n=1 Tax=Cupriavidus nantongensis TaxID=1796606 RepID=UPI0022451E2A|nr:ATP-binding protein [Cupriavidus nantongensis]